MADPRVEAEVKRWIDGVKEAGTTAGGVRRGHRHGGPPGLGSYVAWDRRLDGRLGQALMCIPAIKGVEVGGGVGLAGLPGIDVHDEVFPGGNPAALFLGKFLLPFHRDTNRAGGLEGGMTNGEPVSSGPR